MSKEDIKRRQSEAATSEEESAEEDSSEEELSDADSSDIFTIGGKTSYAAFMDRLDDVSYHVFCLRRVLTFPKFLIRILIMLRYIFILYS